MALVDILDLPIAAFEQRNALEHDDSGVFCIRISMNLLSAKPPVGCAVCMGERVRRAIVLPHTMS